MKSCMTKDLEQRVRTFEMEPSDGDLVGILVVVAIVLNINHLFTRHVIQKLVARKLYKQTNRHTSKYVRTESCSNLEVHKISHQSQQYFTLSLPSDLEYESLVNK